VKYRAFAAVVRCMVVRAGSFANISWSSVQNGARLGTKVAPDPTSERAEQVLSEALQSKMI
jgi:hypothetical protein